MSASEKSPTFSSMSQNLQKIWENVWRNSEKFWRNFWESLRKFLRKSKKYFYQGIHELMPLININCMNTKLIECSEKSLVENYYAIWDTKMPMVAGKVLPNKMWKKLCLPLSIFFFFQRYDSHGKFTPIDVPSIRLKFTMVIIVKLPQYECNFQSVLLQCNC